MFLVFLGGGGRLNRNCFVFSYIATVTFWDYEIRPDTIPLTSFVVKIQPSLHAEVPQFCKTNAIHSSLPSALILKAKVGCEI